MTSPCGKIRIPINESSDDKSQIQEYLVAYHGEGIQHVALGTDDIYATVEALRARSVAFQDTPDTYYELLADAASRPQGGHGAAAAQPDPARRRAGRDEMLLQIFTMTVIGPIFFEIIQRKGNEGFGEGNFRALFESIELDQIRRGVLKALSVASVAAHGRRRFANRARSRGRYASRRSAARGWQSKTRFCVSFNGLRPTNDVKVSAHSAWILAAAPARRWRFPLRRGSRRAGRADARPRFAGAEGRRDGGPRARARSRAAATGCSRRPISSTPRPIRTALGEQRSARGRRTAARRSRSSTRSTRRRPSCCAARSGATSTASRSPPNGRRRAAAAAAGRGPPIAGGSLTFSLGWRFEQGAGFLAGLSLAVGVAVARALEAEGFTRHRAQVAERPHPPPPQARRHPDRAERRCARAVDDRDRRRPQRPAAGGSAQGHRAAGHRSRDASRAAGATPSIATGCSRASSPSSPPCSSTTRTKASRRSPPSGSIGTRTRASRCTLLLPDGATVTGKVAGVDASGALVLADGPRRARFLSGEISLRRA